MAWIVKALQQHLTILRCWEGPGVSRPPSFLKKYKSQRADIFRFQICLPWPHWFWGSDSTLYVRMALASFYCCELFLQKQHRETRSTVCRSENEYQVPFLLLWCDIHWFMLAPKTDNFWHSFIWLIILSHLYQVSKGSTSLPDEDFEEIVEHMSTLKLVSVFSQVQFR